MRFLYDLFFIMFSVLYIPSLLIKGKFHRDFLQRLGFLPSELKVITKPVWIHAVSVGEAVLATKLSGAIKEKYPHIPIVVSTTTQTGNDMVLKHGKGLIDAVFYYPLDLSSVVSRVIRIVDPRIYVMVETELWPNLLEELSARDIPVMLVNGRISDNSFKNYKKIQFVIRRILEKVDHFCMQSGKDKEKICMLGASGESVDVTGNIKFDESIGTSISDIFNKQYLGFKDDDKVIVAGSTHFPEEHTVIDVFKDIKEDRNDIKLVLASRHIERADALRIYIEKSGLKYKRFSDILKDKDKTDSDYDVILVDTIGHLKDIYNAADIVFIGGSLAKKGGQNPIEAARWGKAVIFGPYMFNFKEVSEMFLENNAAVRVKDGEELKKVFKEFLDDPDRAVEIGKRARKVIEDNSGALVKTVKSIEEYLLPEPEKVNDVI